MPYDPFIKVLDNLNSVLMEEVVGCPMTLSLKSWII